MLTGSAPPAQWLQPATWFFVVCLYGPGTVLVRELSIRWRTGVIGVILLGAAYGILEEGLDVMSFFNTAWPDLGNAALYGRWGDTSWLWTVHLTGFHAIFSIVIPILIVHLVFPQARNEPWLGRPGLGLMAALLFLSVAGGNVLFRQLFHYSPPALPYLGAVLAVILLMLAARRTRPPAIDPLLESVELPRAAMYGLTGFLLTIAFFICAWVIPATPIPAVLDILLMLGLAGIAMAIVFISYRHGARFTDSRKLALAAGGLTFFLLLTPILAQRGVDLNTGENYAGMGWVGLIAAVLLLLLILSVQRRERKPAA
jgi:hypothetical protein